jgi:tetratricopeptide (TPR) repeat protein
MTEKKTPVLAKHQALLAFCLGTLAASVTAQNIAPPTPPEVEQAFREVIANANSADARTKYATLLVRAGNFEGGIAALEGLLLMPDAPASIRVELGVLYYRLGSYAISESYLRAALEDPRLEPALKIQADSLLRDVVQRNKTTQLSGSLMIGVRGQSNPTGATDNNQVYYLGVPVARGKDAGPKSDVDTHVWGKLDHVFDLDKQNEAAVVTSLVAYANHYNSVDSYTKQVGYSKPFDLAILAGSTGIRFKPMAPTELTIRPHLIFGGALANGSAYFTNTGFGIDGDYRVSESLAWGGAYENTKLSFSSREDMANVTLQGGTRQAVRLNASVEAAPGRFLLAELGYADQDGNAVYTGYRGPQLRVSYLLSYGAPFGSMGLPWTTTLSASTLRRDYRGADPSVDSLTVRNDTEWRTSLLNYMPLTRDLALQFQLEYSNTSSNISNFSNTNTSGSLGVIWKY